MNTILSLDPTYVAAIFFFIGCFISFLLFTIVQISTKNKILENTKKETMEIVNNINKEKTKIVTELETDIRRLVKKISALESENDRLIKQNFELSSNKIDFLKNFLESTLLDKISLSLSILHDMENPEDKELSDKKIDILKVATKDLYYVINDKYSSLSNFLDYKIKDQESVREDKEQDSVVVEETKPCVINSLLKYKLESEKAKTLTKEYRYREENEKSSV